jgi:hypothetical protein
MKGITLILLAALTVYGQRGHGAVGAGNAGGAPWGTNAPAAGMHGNAGSPERAPDLGTISHQSPETILERNTKLSSKLDSLLPAGTTAQQACAGFKNLGDCVSAIHVAHNLGIPFEELKDKLTGANREKLGQAIHDLKPEADVKAEVKKAHKQAEKDITESSEPPLS